MLVHYRIEKKKKKEIFSKGKNREKIKKKRNKKNKKKNKLLQTDDLQ